MRGVSVKLLCLLWLVPIPGPPRVFSADAGVRSPAVEGRFYPGDPEQLRFAVKSFLEAASPATDEKPLAVLAPHAGYAFSGQICADAFRRAGGHDYDLVVILGTNHTVPAFRGVAIDPGRSFRTPLGEVAIDQEVVQRLVENSSSSLNRAPHIREHSIEVQLPFIQHLFPRAKIVAAVVGAPDPDVCRSFGASLAGAIRDRSALIVASCDLSHYPQYDKACAVDRRTLEAMASLDPDRLREAVRLSRSGSTGGLSTCACGEAPALATLSALKALGAKRADIVSYANSGDTLLGERGRVVGYGAVAFYGAELDGPKGRSATNAVGAVGLGSTGSGSAGSAPDDMQLGAEDHKALLGFARKAIDQYLRSRTVPLPRGFDARLLMKRGAFVTLKKNGKLRGCIGHLIADSSLARIVGNLALQSAFNDRRFTPVRLEELPQIRIEISVLTPAKTVADPLKIRVGRDGVILSKDGHRAVFLPQVATEQGWDRRTLLDHLARKAGLPADGWRSGATFSTFQAEVFHEED